MNRAICFLAGGLAIGSLAGCGGGGASGNSPVISVPPTTPSLTTGASARFHVDVQTGKVSIVKGTTPSNSRTIFAGTSIAFNSSTLSNLPASTGVGSKVLSVSLTNNSGVTIGADSNGNPTGLQVIFNNFQNIGSFPNVTNLTNVNTIGTGFNTPYGVAYGGNGTVYVADTFHNQVRMISGGNVSVLAGSGTASEVDGNGAKASFNLPLGIAYNSVDGSLIVTDFAGDKIRRVSSTGQVNTIAGTGSVGNANGAGGSATFASPWGITTDGAGNTYLTETKNNDIRKIHFNGGDPTQGANYTVSLLAGGSQGFTDGSGSSALFNSPYGIVYGGGNLYVADTANNAIRQVTPSGVTVTIAGNGGAGITDGPGNTANFVRPSGIAYTNGTVIVDEGLTTSGDINLRQITPLSGVSQSSSAGWQTSTIAANGTKGDVDGNGVSAEFNNPMLLTSDVSGNVYLADNGNNAVREISPSNGVFPIGVPNGTIGTIEQVQLQNPSGTVATSAYEQTYPFVVYSGSLSNGATSPTQPWVFTVPAGVNAFEFDVTVQATTSITTGIGFQSGGDPSESQSIDPWSLKQPYMTTEDSAPLF